MLFTDTLEGLIISLAICAALFVLMYLGATR